MKIQNLTFGYGKNLIFNDFNLDIEKGKLSSMHIDKAIIVTYELCKKIFQK